VDEQSRAHAVGGVGQAAVVDIHVIDLDRDRLVLVDRMRPFVLGT
jgi:hypothetical protein